MPSPAPFLDSWTIKHNLASRRLPLPACRVAAKQMESRMHSDFAVASNARERTAPEREALFSLGTIFPHWVLECQIVRSGLEQ
jgi:hypothetical protein